MFENTLSGNLTHMTTKFKKSSTLCVTVFLTQDVLCHRYRKMVDRARGLTEVVMNESCEQWESSWQDKQGSWQICRGSRVSLSEPIWWAQQPSTQALLSSSTGKVHRARSICPYRPCHSQTNLEAIPQAVCFHHLGVCCNKVAGARVKCHPQVQTNLSGHNTTVFDFQ